MTAEVVMGRKFGNRTGYSPGNSDDTDEHVKFDAQYLSRNPDELGSCLRTLESAHDDLSEVIADIRKKPPEERRMYSATLDLHDLYIELCRARSLRVQATYCAQLVIEIEERIEAAQRYIVERAPR